MTETANRWIGFYMMATMTFKSFLTNVQVFLSFQWVSNGNIGQIWINGLNIVKLDHKSYIGIYTSYNPNWFVSGLLYDGLAGLWVPALPLILLEDAEFKFAPPQVIQKHFGITVEGILHTPGSSTVWAAFPDQRSPCSRHGWTWMSLKKLSTFNCNCDHSSISLRSPCYICK